MDALKRLARKTVEALLVTVGSVVGTVLSFLGKAIGLVAKHAWAIIVLLVGFIAAWLMERDKKG